MPCCRALNGRGMPLTRALMGDEAGWEFEGGGGLSPFQAWHWHFRVSASRKCVDASDCRHPSQSSFWGLLFSWLEPSPVHPEISNLQTYVTSWVAAEVASCLRFGKPWDREQTSLIIRLSGRESQHTWLTKYRLEVGYGIVIIGILHSATDTQITTWEAS